MPLRLRHMIRSEGQFTAQKWIHDDVDELTDYKIISN